MSKKEKNVLTPADLAGKWRIRGKSGAAYIGEVSGSFDNALILDQVDGEKVIIFMDAIESMYEGIISPKAAAGLEASKNEPA